MENLVEQWLNWPNWSLHLYQLRLVVYLHTVRTNPNAERKELVEGNILAGKMAVFELNKFSGIQHTH